ncbi:MAG: excinuclease ABC subunit B [Candidatus Hydrothermota bacterium]|nr:MAG: excinuclease ABC subunit B [Candidatus Hydrothermae bacterium]
MFGIDSEITWSRPRGRIVRTDKRLKSVIKIVEKDSVHRFKSVFGFAKPHQTKEPAFTGELFPQRAPVGLEVSPADPADEKHVLKEKQEISPSPPTPLPKGEGSLSSLPVAFDIVKSVRKVTSPFKFVYDFEVEEDETFAAGLGGIFVHNTFTMANVIAQIGKPTLVISHNKTLAAQLYGELKSFFPENAVEFFISYYDYYQPEAYIPETDTYIEKDADINEDIERLRLRATTALMERDDVIIVASVSAIYGLGDPADVKKLFILVEVGQEMSRDELIHRLVDIQYTRNDIELKRGTFRVRGDVVDIVPAYEEHIVRIEFFGDFVDSIRVIHPVTGKTLEVKQRVAIYPAGHWVTTRPKLEAAIRSIEEELEERLRELRAQGKLLEAQRLEQRTRFDLQMLREIGYCKGIENYSRHLSGRPPGTRPACLIDYFPKDFLMIIDESHVTIPQLRGMYHGDRSRKLTLVEYGFRLPSALDNRPLKFEELEELWNQVIFVSATPGPYELEKSGGLVVEQIIRPTGLVDPKITVKPTENQIDVMINEIRKRVDRNERVLITTLTKRTAEELADYLSQVGFRVRYLHSEIDAIERVEILRGLRLGEFDVLVGVNLLREGLDLPEVSLVIITDADKTGFLRSETSLIQVAGRAARNAAGEVLMFADEITPAMRKAIEETERRRRIQMEYNKKHGIVPKTIRKSVQEIKLTTRVADERILEREDIRQVKLEIEQLKRAMGKFELIEELERRMQIAASLLEFEKAAVYRDALMELKGMRRKGRVRGG